MTSVEGGFEYECEEEEREKIRCGDVVDFYVAKLLNPLAALCQGF